MNSPSRPRRNSRVSISPELPSSSFRRRACDLGAVALPASRPMSTKRWAAKRAGNALAVPPPAAAPPAALVPDARMEAMIVMQMLIMVAVSTWGTAAPMPADTISTTAVKHVPAQLPPPGSNGGSDGADGGDCGTDGGGSGLMIDAGGDDGGINGGGDGAAVTTILRIL